MTTTLARSTDPLTSKMAATSTAKSPARYTMKNALLLEFAQRSLTSEEAAERAGLLGTGYWKRVSDLFNEGLITERTQPNVPNGHPVYFTTSGKYAVMRLNHSGKHALVWKITDKGRAAVREIKANSKG